MLALILLLFKPSCPVSINLPEIERKQAALSPVTAIEKRTLLWILIAIVLWLTDALHGVNIGWICLWARSLPLWA